MQLYTATLSQSAVWHNAALWLMMSPGQPNQLANRFPFEAFKNPDVAVQSAISAKMGLPYQVTTS